MITSEESSSVKAENRCAIPDNSAYELPYLDFNRNMYTIPVNSFHRVYETPHVADSGCGF